MRSRVSSTRVPSKLISLSVSSNLRKSKLRNFMYTSEEYFSSMVSGKCCNACVKQAKLSYLERKKILKVQHKFYLMIKFAIKNKCLFTVVTILFCYYFDLAVFVSQLGTKWKFHEKKPFVRYNPI